MGTKYLKHSARSTEFYKRTCKVNSLVQTKDFAAPIVGEPWPSLSDADVHWPTALESHLEYSSETRPDHSTKKFAIRFKATHIVFAFVLALIVLIYAVATNNTKLVSDVLRWSKGSVQNRLSP